MARQISSKRQLKPDSVKKSLKNKDDEVKQSKRRSSGIKKLLQPLQFLGKAVKWLGKHIVPRYFKNSFAELKLVTWPKRKESRQLTTAVMLFAIVMGAVVTGVDYGLDKIFKKVILKQ